MLAAAQQERNDKAAEYLQLLRSLAAEMEVAMQSIARNSLSEFEDSVASQQLMSSRLVALVNELCIPLESNPSTSEARMDECMIHQIQGASETLQALNRRYAALLQHSSRSVAQMTSLFSSFQGQFQEASGPRLKHQTWSCQM